jgi:hypothetical protein
MCYVGARVCVCAVLYVCLLVSMSRLVLLELDYRIKLKKERREIDEHVYFIVCVWVTSKFDCFLGKKSASMNFY